MYGVTSQKPITVAALSKAWNVFARWNIGIVGSKPNYDCGNFPATDKHRVHCRKLTRVPRYRFRSRGRSSKNIPALPRTSKDTQEDSRTFSNNIQRSAFIRPSIAAENIRASTWVSAIYDIPTLVTPTWWTPQTAPHTILMCKFILYLC
jgi:hypothetical protein